jgi:hypothetical protein
MGLLEYRSMASRRQVVLVPEAIRWKHAATLESEAPDPICLIVGVPSGVRWRDH